MTEITRLGAWQIAFWWLAFTVGTATWWVVYGGQHRNPQHDRELAWWLWHWFTGGPLEQFRAYPGGGGWPRRCARRAGKAVVRSAATAGVAAGVYVQSGSAYGTELATIATLGGAGVVGLALVTVLIAYVAMEWSMWRHYIEPTFWAVAKDAGWDLDMRWWQIRRIINIPRGLSWGDGVAICCGPTFKPLGEVEKKVVEIITMKLGLSKMIPGWKREGIHRYLEFTRQEPVPDKVRFSNEDVKKLIEAESTSSKILRGFTRAGKPVWTDLDKSPHVLISAGTGGGKSVALAAVAAQMLWHRAIVVVLDIKRMSHLWLRDLPDVRYARSIEEIHRTLCDLMLEVERRTRLWDPITFDQREAGQIPQFPRMLIIFDEISTTMSRLQDHWSDIREPGDPQRSPAKRAWSDILNMGRQVHVNVFAAGQRGSANAVGSGDARENFEEIDLIDRYSEKTWKMLAPECGYVPGVSHAGRGQICIGATATETQFLLMTEREAYRWVTDKIGSQPRVPHPVDTVSPGETVGDGGHYGTRDRLPAVTLWEASKDKGRGIVTLNFEALKKQAQRDLRKGLLPEPVGKRGGSPTYDPRDLQEWQERKTSPMASDGVAGDNGNEGDEVDRVDTRERESEGNYPEDNWLQQESSSGDIDWDEFYANVASRDEAGCERWTAGHNGDGYGYMRDKAGRVVAVHRLAYENQVGPIGERLVVDHICGTKDCTRGDHLQAVTNGRNVELRHERDRARQGVAT